MNNETHNRSYKMDFMQYLLESDEDELKSLHDKLADLNSNFTHIDRQSSNDKEQYAKAKSELTTKINKLEGTHDKPENVDTDNTAQKAVTHWENQLVTVSKKAEELEKTAPPKGQRIAPSDIENGKKRHKYLHALGEVNIVKRELKAAKAKLAAK